ncbi:hypothetical protein [Nocardia sp. CNY236]|uniref:Rv3212 family protein n=1 Tax=Nocardia sp. CNY236 TaxID=1169152 RepID=UPI00040AFC73|nr:hypothetical protein [Nocardia sp. CNY236]
MLAPERRTLADSVTAAAIAFLVMVAAVVIWVRSDVRSAESITAETPVPTPTAAGRLPSSLQELWHTPDDANTRALVSAGVAVTGAGGTVTGRDPRTGDPLWTYRRDLPLCGVESQYGVVAAVYRDPRGCSQTTLLAGDSGARLTARSSYMDSSVRLSVDGTHFLAQGGQRLEMWRSDLVRTVEYGFVDARVNVKTQPRTGCALLSSSSSPSRLAVLERCPSDPANRLTVLNPVPKDNTTPEEYGSRVLTGPGMDSADARVIAASDSRIVVYLPAATTETESPPPRLGVYDHTGNPIVIHELSAPLSKDATTTQVGSTYLVFTGNGVIALDGSTFDPLWTVDGALGAPTVMAGKLLLPTTDALAVLDLATGAEIGRIPVDRPDYTGGPISLAVLGNIVLERRNDQIHALG